jgi:hypothetical protein
MRGLLGLLLLVAPLGALAASRFHERNHSGLLFLYAFDEGQQSASPPSHVRDVSGQNLMGDLTVSTTGAVTWSATRQGMTVPSGSGGPRAVSQSTSAGVLSRLTDTFSLEFFLTSSNSPSVREHHSIAGFGNWSAGSDVGFCDSASSTTEGGWRLASVSNVIAFYAVFEVDGAPSCLFLSVTNNPPVRDTLRHVVVRAYEGVFSMIVHTVLTLTGSGNVAFSPALWARNFAPLTIASPNATTGWTGSLRMIAMYDRYLSEDEVALNRVLGPPNSFPYGGGALDLDEDVAATLVSAT